MKIMVVTTLYPPIVHGGAERSTSMIAIGLAERGHDVSVLTLHDDPASTESVENGVTVLRRPLRNLYWPFPSTASRWPLAKLTFHAIDTLNPLMARAVTEALREHRPDIVLSNQLSCFSTMAWRAIHDAQIPILHSLRDFYLLCPKSGMFRNNKPCSDKCAECRVLSYPRKRMSHYVGGVTAVSQYMIDRHRSFGLFPNALVLPPILSAVRAQPTRSAQLSTPPGSVRRFGFIGRVEPTKGVDLLLDGLMTAPTDRWSLVIAGTGSEAYGRHLRQRCAGLPVEFLGFVQDSIFYNQVDIVAVPSVYEEPLPRTVLEAYAYGLPVIATMRGGIPEVVMPGRTGYLVDPDKPDEVASAIRRAIDDPMEGRRFGEAGRQMVVNRTEATVAADYEAASLQVIEYERLGGRVTERHSA